MGRRVRAKGLIIAIDGVAASGKSTTAKIVARRLEYTYLDSGALYRAVTLQLLRDGVDFADKARMVEIAERLEIRLTKNGEVLLGGKDVSLDIRSPEVTERIGPVAANERIRRLMVTLQRRIGRNGGIVADGRDIGTVVFPDAELKFFFTASLSERARRRAKEYDQQKFCADIEHLARQLHKRDQDDSSRDHGPLLKAEDAIVVDTSSLSIEEQVAIVLEEAHNMLNDRRLR